MKSHTRYSTPVRLSALALAPLLLIGAASRGATPTWQENVNQIIGWKGETMPDNVLRFTLTPNLRVRVNGNPVLPNLALDGYAAFHAEGSQVTLAAEVVTPEWLSAAVVDAATRAGLKVTADHNHLLNESPRVLFVHMTGLGQASALARGVKAALAATHLRIRRDEDEQDADDKAPGLNTDALEAILKSSGKPVDGVLEFSFERPEAFTLAGRSFPASMGPESEVHFQSLGDGRAAEVAEIALLANEVPKALRLLQESGQNVRVTALHNHFLTEEPRLFFLHTWGTGDARGLARTVRAVLDQTPQ
jgi:hypothetical protein